MHGSRRYTSRSSPPLLIWGRQLTLECVCCILPYVVAVRCRRAVSPYVVFRPLRSDPRVVVRCVLRSMRLLHFAVRCDAVRCRRDARACRHPHTASRPVESYVSRMPNRRALNTADGPHKTPRMGFLEGGVRYTVHAGSRAGRRTDLECDLYPLSPGPTSLKRLPQRE